VKFQRCSLPFFLLLVVVSGLGCHEGHAHRDFLMPPGADMGAPLTEQVYFAAIGDYGSGEDSELYVAKLVESHDPQFVITMGDNNYPSGERSTIDVNIGRFYSRYIGNYLGRFGIGSPENLFFPCVGNHEWYGPEQLQPYLDYFSALPGNKRYFDFQMGLVHFYVVDSDEHEPDGITADSRQAMWLKDALAAPTTACYKIVYFHHPPYSSGVFHVRKMAWPFAEWGADVVMAGHEHTYERLTVDGIPYFINGLGGAGRFEFHEIDPHSQFRYADDWGAMFVHATKRQIRYTFEDVNGELIDELTIQPKSPCR
jgi:hypothetical protein